VTVTSQGLCSIELASKDYLKGKYWFWLEKKWNPQKYEVRLQDLEIKSPGLMVKCILFGTLFAIPDLVIYMNRCINIHILILSCAKD